MQLYGTGRGRSGLSGERSLISFGLLKSLKIVEESGKNTEKCKMREIR
jgi:hypothetical protein